MRAHRSLKLTGRRAECSVAKLSTGTAPGSSQVHRLRVSRGPGQPAAPGAGTHGTQAAQQALTVCGNTRAEAHNTPLRAQRWRHNKGEGSTELVRQREGAPEGKQKHRQPDERGRAGEGARGQGQVASCPRGSRDLRAFRQRVRRRDTSHS